MDHDRALATSLARRFGIDRVYSDLDELLADCDVIDVCTPPRSHAGLVTAAIDAGLRVVVEKPVVVDLAEWEALADKARAEAIELAVAHHLKFARSVQKSKRWLDQGRIGRLLRIDWQFLTSIDRDRMLGGDAHWSHKLPGGRWFETLPHNLYGIHYLCGPMELASVTALRSRDAPPGATADEVVVSLERAGTVAIFHFSANCRLNQRSVTLTGSRGVITIDLLSDLAWLTRPKDSKLRRLVGRSLIEAGSAAAAMLADRPAYLFARLRRQSPHTRFIAAVDRSLRGEAPPPTPLDELDYVTRYCQRIGNEIENRLREWPASTS